MAASPKFPSPVGSDFTYRDWYGSLSRGTAGYISSVYKGIVDPRSNEIAVASPIDDPTFADRVLGVVVLQIRTDYFSDWLASIDKNLGELTYIIDQKGQIVTGSHMNTESPVISIAGSPIATGLAAGTSGTVVQDDPLGYGAQVATFIPIPSYGWGIIAETSPSENGPGTFIAIASLLLLCYVFALTIVLTKAVRMPTP